MKHSMITRATVTAVSGALLAFAATGVSAAQGTDTSNSVWPAGYGQYANDTQNVADNTYRKGDYVPAELRDRNHVVTDLPAHGLNQPRRGYRWIHDPDHGDFLLIDKNSGVVFAVAPA